MAEDLTEQGDREVFFELNGTLRSVFIRDKDAHKVVVTHPKADKANKKQIGAPMPGTIIDIRVKVRWLYITYFVLNFTVTDSCKNI